MKTLILIAGLLAPSAAAAQASAAPDPNAVTCRITGETGSRLQRSRTCRTRAEWDQLRREQRNTLDRAQTRQVNRTIDEVGRTR